MAIYTGKTIDEAIQNALNTLHLTRKEVNINVIKEPRKGILGISRREAEVEVKSILPQHTGGALQHPELVKQINEQAEEQVTEENDGVEPDKPTDELEDENEDQISPAEIQRRQEANQEKMSRMAEMVAYYLRDILNSMQLPVEANFSVTGRTITVDIITDKPAKVIGRHGMTINALQTMGLTFLNLNGLTKVAFVLDTNDYRSKRAEVLVGVAKNAATEVIASGTAVYLDAMPANERKQIHQSLEDNQFVKTYSHGREPRRSVVVAPANEI
ncbi:RNA-binding cell elongation regulator Jag/EloR [Paucilactobacillus suebicus]|nr:RNA-binding cell elongation regulator Jag/EloR [Paucilactobacillus suebicus]